MIIKVQNETPFQVLTGAFTIGPSQTGYELQVGATSSNFTTLFSVGANTTRMVTNVANGSYYRLKNNVGEVSVNWSRTCVTEGSGGEGGAGNELIPQDTLPQTADAGTVVALTDGGIYQYDGTDWVSMGGDIDLSGYYTSGETNERISSAYTILDEHITEVEQVTASALTELHDDIIELSARTIPDMSLYTPTSGFSTINGSAITNGGDIVIEGGGSTEDIELPIAAAVNDLKGNIEVKLSQKYYTKQEVSDIAARKVEAGQVDAQIKEYVDPAIAEVNETIADKELPVSAAINDLNQKISEISGGSGGDMSAYYTSAQTNTAISAATQNMVTSTTINAIWGGTQAEYDAATQSGATADPTTFYVIKKTNNQ